MIKLLDFGERLYWTLLDLGDFFFTEVVWIQPIRDMNTFLPTGFKLATDLTLGELLFSYAITGILLFKLLKFVVGVVTGS